MTRRFAAGAVLAGWLLCLVLGVSAQAPPPSLPDADRQLLRKMLSDAHALVRDRYVDRRYRGLDWGERFSEYRQKLDGVTSLNAGVAVVADFLEGLHDSHTFLFPPLRPYKVDYGVRYRSVGEGVFIWAVTPGSDAERKVAPGDRVLAVNGTALSRETLADFRYRLALFPQGELRFRVRSPEGVEREETVRSSVTPKPPRTVGSINPAELLGDLNPDVMASRQTFVEQGPALIWRLEAFAIRPEDLASGVQAAATHEAVVLDLRGNGGGFEVVEEVLLSFLVERKTTVGKRVRRTGTSAVTLSPAKPHIGGKVVVLVDSGSASASEIVARALQLAGRAVILGDRTAGAVRAGNIISFADRAGSTVRPYVFQVTVADILMADGQSLEGVGVLPDEVILPSAVDLKFGRDPVLARALALCGVEVTPEAAGKLLK